MSEEALAEREHTRSGYAGLEDGDTAIEMDGHANGSNAPSKAPSKAKVCRRRLHNAFFPCRCPSKSRQIFTYLAL